MMTVSVMLTVSICIINPMLFQTVSNECFIMSATIYLASTDGLFIYGSIIDLSVNLSGFT